jgi:hypothetical protein
MLNVPICACTHACAHALITIPGFKWGPLMRQFRPFCSVQEEEDSSFFLVSPRDKKARLVVPCPCSQRKEKKKRFLRFSIFRFLLPGRKWAPEAAFPGHNKWRGVEEQTLSRGWCKDGRSYTIHSIQLFIVQTRTWCTPQKDRLCPHASTTHHWNSYASHPRINRAELITPTRQKAQ